MDVADYLMLSGIQHFAFCERQWALIHIEQQWLENVLTIEGQDLHSKVDDPFLTESRGNIITLRALPIVSHAMELAGRADVIELQRANDNDDTAVLVAGRPGKWLMVPVEYKRGKPKPDERDEVQLCAQAICLEEMHGTHIENGYLYYGETRHRHEVEFREPLRSMVKGLAKRMHELFDNGVTPPPVFKPHCKSCSLIDVCLPKSSDVFEAVEKYLESAFNAASNDVSVLHNSDTCENS